MAQFKEFQKIPRLNRDIVITEKIDGTNAAILVDESAEDSTEPGILLPSGIVVRAQSRTRFISPEKDNFGFARWVFHNAEELANLLGPGLHFGEWWGVGVQRTYGVKEKRFSLFNVNKWADIDTVIGGVPVRPVPTLFVGSWVVSGVFTPALMLEELQEMGSRAEPGFMDPEGIVVFHTAGSVLFKATCKNDEKPKGSKE
jgi:hypothetical protein